jgi:hypothetical protein
MTGLVAELPKSATDSASPKDVRATLNYVGDMTERAFYDVRDHAGSNIVWDSREVTIHDVRPHLASLSLDETGFAFVKHRSQVAENPALFEGSLKTRDLDTAGLEADYADELCVLIRDMTGAREVFPRFGGLVMRTSMRAETKGWAPPAEFAHLDFAASSMQGWLDRTLAAKPRDLKPYSRMQLFQAWRCISPGPQDSTLAICDGRTVPLEDCVYVDSRVGPAGVAGTSWESRKAHYRDTHRWYYMPDMEPDDLVLFKGYDSDMPDAMNAMHSAFSNPLGQNGVPRRSIEARIIAIYD